jgi:hypothetical protein
MKITYACRSFISMFVLVIINVTGGLNDLQSQSLTRDLNIDLLINQVGYVPGAWKNIVTKGISNGKFDVIDLTSQEVEYTGTLHPVKGDFGEYSEGDFSSLQKEGRYYIKSDTLRSFPFSISASVYKPVMDLIVSYFSLQRCGSSTTGYLSPCHLDDGIRMDNGKHQDVSGGWHDASDLRKWVDATIYAMIGLSRSYELQSGPGNSREKILGELMWGNQYFLKMQEPQGYIMNYVGGDVKKHSDSNRWTNNVIGKEGGDLHLTKPAAGQSDNDMLVFGSNDDRVIRTDPVGMAGQYNFIISEAIMSIITLTGNPVYSQNCLTAAKNCFDWCKTQTKELNAGTIGTSIEASLELYKCTGEDEYKNFAITRSLTLKKLQAPLQDGKFGGFFYTSATDNEPYKNIYQGCLEFISICDLITAFPEAKEAPLWKQMISAYSYQYLLFISQKNSFGIIPFGLYAEKDPGGNRKAGNYWYRYFMQPELDWWVGINANVTSAGIGLMKAAAILKDPRLKAAAQKQLDWVVGVNPFNSSTIEMVGYNHPKHFGGSSFLPSVPVLPGAVLNGLGGDREDMPDIGTGDWQISEYWTPMVAYTLWLMAEISNTEGH